jgi:hypothetical protein
MSNQAEVPAMATRRTVELTAAERAQLDHILRRDPRPYLREKAAAVLKVADGVSARQVALHGLTRTRDPETVYAWLNEFSEHRQVLPQPARRGGFPPQRGRRGASGGAPVARRLRRSAQPLATV